MLVDERAERQAVPERGGHVGDGHIPVALTLDPAPLLQRLHGRHPELQLGPREGAAQSLQPRNFGNFTQRLASSLDPGVDVKQKRACGNHRPPTGEAKRKWM